MTNGQRIAYLRKQKNESQSELAKSVNVSPSTIGMWETDQRAIKDSDLSHLADHFGVTVDYILGRPEPNDGLRVAAHMDDDLTPEQKKNIEDYIEFQKAQYRKDHERTSKKD
ncbi:XRE family transcriptional regulator [Secundilactobacillus pentosiphilus]|uniref:XRE family transcriptional regulator n=1 Tax=Secundilactobacillus pentosiphilus TaxID=1714682 RepID=A0A1Z5J0D0_9LACO|nr:helix-turn-helix transcriptional regulator [Secundilactobacillus pentosiphilus]GAX07181.1 XRE family transcriptional regulator [Secundilactobacillus pentosiphilus]